MIAANTQHLAIWSTSAEAPKLCQKHWTSPKGKQTLRWKNHFYNGLQSQISSPAGQHYTTQHQKEATFWNRSSSAWGADLSRSRPIRQQSSRIKMAVKKCSVTSQKVEVKIVRYPTDQFMKFAYFLKICFSCKIDFDGTSPKRLTWKEPLAIR